MDQKRRNRFGEEFHLQRFLHHLSRVNYEDWAPSVSTQQPACFEFEISTKKTLEISELSRQLSMKKWLPARRGERLWMATISHAAMTSAANVVSKPYVARQELHAESRSDEVPISLGSRLLHVVFASGLCWSKRKKCLLSISCGSNSFWIGVLCLKQRLSSVY